VKRGNEKYFGIQESLKIGVEKCFSNHVVNANW
jgi:hypothetical protein